MSVTQDEPAAPAAGTPPQRPGIGRRLIEDVTTGRSWFVTILAILVGLVVGAVMIVLSDQSVLSKFGYFFSSPGDALSGSWSDISTSYIALFKGAIFDPGNAYSASTALHPISETLTEATPLMLGGLSVAIAFRAGLFNIGGQGQLVAGAVCSSYVAASIQLPHVIHLLVAILVGIGGGAVWGGIVGLLKARTGAHEVIVTIMMNYIAVALLAYLITTSAFKDPTNPQPVSKPAHGTARLPHLFGASERVTFGLLLALAAIAFCWWLLNRSTLGFELRMVGASPPAARTAGMSVGKAQIIAMAIAGALMGIVGVSQVLGTANANNALTPQIDAGLGFTAITVALLGRASPLGVVLASLLFGALEAGGRAMQASNAQVSIEIVGVIQAVIVLCVAAPPLIRAIFRLRGSHVGTAAAEQITKGWNG